MRLEDLDVTEIGVLISSLPPTHPLVAAARAGVDVSDGRAELGREHGEAQRDIGEAWRDTGGSDRAAGDRRMWEARRDAARDDAAAAREAAGDASRAYQAADMEAAAERADRHAEQARQRTSPLPPMPREPSGTQLRPETETAVRWAREWVAAQEEAEHTRYDNAYGYTRDEGDVAERCAERAR